MGACGSCLFHDERDSGRVGLPPCPRSHGERQVATVPDRKRLHVICTHHDDHDPRVVLPQVSFESRRPVVIVAPRQARVLETFLNDAHGRIGREHVSETEAEVLTDGVTDGEQRQRVEAVGDTSCGGPGGGGGDGGGM